MTMSGSPWIPAVICVLALARLGFALGEKQRSAVQVRSEPTALSTEAVGLIGQLRGGDDLAGWTVQTAEGPTDGAIRVWVAKDGVRWAIELRRAGRGPNRPPRSTKRLDLFYGFVQPPDAQVDPADTAAVLDALAERIAKHEELGPLPSGM